MKHTVYLIKMRMRNSEAVHVFEFSDERERDTRLKELVSSAKNGDEIASVKPSHEERDNDPKGLLRHLSRTATIVSHHLHNMVAIKTMLSSDQVIDKLSVVSMQTSIACHDKSTEHEIVKKAKDILLSSHNIRV